MAIVNKVDLKLKVNLNNSIKYQILTFCFFERIIISNSDLEFLAELKIFKSAQSARNAISKAEKKNLVIKKGSNKKTIVLNKTINVQKDGLVLLDYKILGSESQEA